MLKIDINSRGGEFLYHVISLDDYKDNKPITLNWLEEELGGLGGDSEVFADITNANITVTLNDKEILYKEVNELTKLKIDKNPHSYWRSYSGAGEDEIGVVWFHESECYWWQEWSEVNEFDPSKLKVSAEGSPMHEKDGSAFGEIIVSYDDSYEDESDFESSPVIGYIGPFTYATRKGI